MVHGRPRAGVFNSPRPTYEFVETADEHRYHVTIFAPMTGLAEFDLSMEKEGRRKESKEGGGVDGGGSDGDIDCGSGGDGDNDGGEGGSGDGGGGDGGHGDGGRKEGR